MKNAYFSKCKKKNKNKLSFILYFHMYCKKIRQIFCTGKQFKYRLVIDTATADI